MSFETNKSNKNKAQFTARLVSKVSGKAFGFFNPTPEFCRAVMGKDITEVTAEELIVKTISLLQQSELVITDTTVPLEVVSPDAF